MDKELINTLVAFTHLGTTWVLWLLVGLSVLSIAVVLERAVFYWRIKLDFREFTAKLVELLVANKTDTLLELCKPNQSLECQIAARGLEFRDKGHKAMEEAMTGYLTGERSVLDRGLVILGTLGNNAPFIGLFGTVLGIIQAFSDLASNPAGGPAVVMAGISEALVATAIGLVVAIPAVIAFNGFQRLVKRHYANAEATMRIILSHHQP